MIPDNLVYLNDVKVCQLAHFSCLKCRKVTSSLSYVHLRHGGLEGSPRKKIVPRFSKIFIKNYTKNPKIVTCCKSVPIGTLCVPTCSKSRSGKEKEREKRDSINGILLFSSTTMPENAGCQLLSGAGLLQICANLRQNRAMMTQICANLRQNRAMMTQICANLRQNRAGLMQICANIRQNRAMMTQICANLRQTGTVLLQTNTEIRQIGTKIQQVGTETRHA